jgi:hypothetical protein
MKINYICECCDEIIDELDVDDFTDLAGALEGLTAEERHDIIKMHSSGGRVFVVSLCDDCVAGLGLNDDHDLIFTQAPIKH